MWLLAATGDPHRSIRIGFDRDSGEEIIRPASTFHFPACGVCNWSYGKALEKQAKKIVLAISDGRGITVAQAYRLLDWLDKVRIGLWLGYHMLNKETRFRPKFHIDTRIGRKDRIAIINVTPCDNTKVLSFGGYDNDVFSTSQCGLYLRINNLRILSLSFDYAVSPEAGLPTGSKQALLPENTGFYHTDLQIGSFELAQEWPLFSALGSTIIAQPIIDTGSLPPERSANLYFNSRVLNHAKNRVRVHASSDWNRILPLQLISNATGHFQYYPNKLARLRFTQSGLKSDIAFMQNLYRFILERVLPLFPLEIRLPDGTRHPSIDQYRAYSEMLFQIICRIASMGLPTPDTAELIDDIQRFHRLIEERDASLVGTLAHPEGTNV
jgi:hypothetical protein